MDFTLQGALAILEVIWINIILSGDNAVVIAMARPAHCRPGSAAWAWCWIPA